MNYIPKFDETGHLNYLDNPSPTYMDLIGILTDCVGLLNEINVEDHLLETYANVLMNAENIIQMHNQIYEDGHRLADNELDD